MLRSKLLVSLATFALALCAANAQGPDCKTGPHPTIFAVQQKCAKGSLLCKQAEVTAPISLFVRACLTHFQVDIVSFNMDAPQKIEKVIYPSGTPLPPPCSRQTPVKSKPKPLVKLNRNPPRHTRAVISNINRKETEYASVLSASDSNK